MPNPISDILWYINSEVDKLSGTSLDRMSEVLDDAQKELADDLARWSAQLKGDDRFTPAVYRNALWQIRGALDHIKGSHPAIGAVLQYGGQAAGAMATRHLAEEAQKFSSVFEGVVRPIALEAATVISAGEQILWPRFARSARRYSGQVHDDIRRQLAIGVVRGETIDQMTTRLARLGGPAGLVDLGHRHEVISEGLFKRYRYWGERLARTEVVNAYNTFTHLGIEDIADGEEGYFKRWDAAVDGRLCLLCREMDDQIVPVDKTFRHGFKHPPRHPNCRCAVVLWRKEWGAADRGDALTPGRAPDTSVVRIHTPKPPPPPKPPPAQKPPPERTRRARAPTRPPRPVVDFGEIWGRRTQAHMDFSHWARSGWTDQMRDVVANPAHRASSIALMRTLNVERLYGISPEDAVDWIINQRRVDLALRAQREWDLKHDPVARRKHRAAQRRAQTVARQMERERKREAAAAAIAAKHEEIRGGIRTILTYGGRYDDSIIESLASSFGVPAKTVRRLGAQVQREHERAARERARLARQHAREERAAEAERRRRMRQAGKALAVAQAGAEVETARHLAAVEAMKAAPMATTIHPRVDVSGVFDFEGNKRHFERRLREWGFNEKLTLEEITHALAPPEGFISKLKSIEGGTLKFNIYEAKTGKLVTENFTRDFMRKYQGPEVHHSLFIVKREFQGAKISDTINGQMVLRYAKWGCQVATVDAAWVGRYAWARMGFTFEHPQEMAGRVERYIRSRIKDPAKAAEYIAQSRELVKKPWKLAKWDPDGATYHERFHTPDGNQEGDYPLGKAFLLHENNSMWSGSLPIHPGDEGYLNALRTLRVADKT